MFNNYQERHHTDDDESYNLYSSTQSDLNRISIHCDDFSLDYLQLDPIERIVFRVADERDSIQKKTFTKWINKHLNKIGIQINDLFNDLRDGTNLILLLEILSKNTLPKEKGILRFHAIQNIKTCLDLLKQYKIKLVNIRADEIVDGNSKLTLGLIWIIILYFQIVDNILNKYETTNRIYDFNKISNIHSCRNEDENNARENLLKWVQKHLDGYCDIKCNNFSSCWRDGRVLLTLLHRHKPDKIDLSKVDYRTNRENLQIAFNFAESEFGITKILDPEDLDCGTVDEKSVITYISMLYNTMPFIPVLPSQFHVESERRSALDEYAIMSRALVRWLNESSFTMDNKSIPKNLNEIKTLINDIKAFQLDEYALRLKEKKKLVKLHSDLNRLYDSKIPAECEHDIITIDKLWENLDSLIQEKIKFLENTVKTEESLEVSINRINKLYANCMKKYEQVEQSFIEISLKRDTMTSTQINISWERLEEQLKLCDEDIRKMYLENEKVKEIGEKYGLDKKISELHNKIEELRSKFHSEFKSPKKPNNLLTLLNQTNPLEICKQWIKIKQKLVRNVELPHTLEEIEKDLLKQNLTLKEIEEFKVRVDDAKSFISKSLDDPDIEDYKHDLNEVEISLNLLYNYSINRARVLEHLLEYVKELQIEFHYIESKEDIEVSRDWSSPQKADSFKLNIHKQKLDEDMNERFSSIEKVINHGNNIVVEFPAASKVIQSFIGSLKDRWNWLSQLSYALGVHLKNLNSLELYNQQCKEIETKLIESNEDLVKLCNKHNQIKSKITFKNTTDRFDFDSFISDLSKFLEEFIKNENDILSLTETSKNIIPFKMRAQKLVYPNNKCISIINYKKGNFQIHQDEQCQIEENLQRTKWKILNRNQELSMVPSVCFILTAIDQDSYDLSERLIHQYQNLRILIVNCIRQCRREKILTELEDLRYNLNYLYENYDYETQIVNIKTQIDDYVSDTSTHHLNSSSNNASGNEYDIDILIEMYHHCYQKYLEFKSRLHKEKDEELEVYNKTSQLEIRLNTLIENYKNFIQINKLVNNEEHIENLIKKFHEFEQTHFKEFEKECEELRRNKQAKVLNIDSQYEALRNDAGIYSKNLDDVKLLIQLINTESRRLSKIEAKLCDQSSAIEDSSISKLSNNIESLLVELENIKNSIKTKQDDCLLNQIIDLTDTIKSNKTKLRYEVVNLKEILLHSDLVVKRYKELTVHLADREALLNQLLRTIEQYKKSKNIETNWLESIKYKANKLIEYEKQREEIGLNQSYVQNLKNSFDSNAELCAELGSKEPQIEELNDISVKLIQLLKRYDQLLNDYQKYLQSLTSGSINTTINNSALFDILKQIGQDINDLNRQYADLLKEFHYKTKLLTNSIAQTTDQKISYNPIQNVEKIIEKYTRNIFERYELTDEFFNTNFNSSQLSTPRNINYLNDLMDINTLNIDTPYQHHQQQTSSISSVKYYTSKTDNLNESTATSSSSSVSFPLTFIEAVNRKYIDLESGYFKDPQTGLYNLRLYDALQKQYLSPKSAYITDPNSKKCYYLNEAYHNGLINGQNRLVIDSKTSLTLSDALKNGYLKLGHPSTSASSYSAETQSMSVRSIKDTTTGEFIMPAEAIKRKILDPYKGQYVDPANGEHLPIGDAIKKGYVIVEILNDSLSNISMSDRSNDSSLISTNLVRETKSYHLISVFDPVKNCEISVKEAISRGLLDRQRGLYIHPLTNEHFSISDAINKGVVHARVLMPPSDISHDNVVSSNKFQENKTYTICGAIDPRTNKIITLNQAINDGIIDTKNGTYINIVTGNLLTLNVAIEKCLVITDTKQLRDEQEHHHEQHQEQRSVITSAPLVNREIKTLTIEFVKDLRSGRDVSVSEAMHSGLLDRHTLQYHNFVTNEKYSLNKAYEKGFIIGHYSDKFSNELHSQSTKTTNLIISVHDPRTKQNLTVDQAIKTGIFNYDQCTYFNPLTREKFSLHEAIEKGFIEAKTGNEYDRRLPVGNFGIDKQIKSMQTKFRQDGSSVLQIDIESTQPTRGIYEVDEVEEYTLKPSQPKHKTEFVIDHHDTSHRQVIDINSVYRIPSTTKIDVPIINNNHVHQKNVLVFDINKEIGKTYKIDRHEHIIEDEESKRVLHIDVPGKKKEIQERKINTYIPYAEEIQRVETLIIDDVDTKRVKPVHIDSQIHSFKNELIIDEKFSNQKKQQKHKYLEINEDLVPKTIDNYKQIKIHAEVIDDGKQNRPIKYISIDDKPTKISETHTTSSLITEEVTITKKISENTNTNVHKKLDKSVLICIDDESKQKVKKQSSDDEIRTDTFDQEYYETRIVNKIKPIEVDEIRNDSWTEYMRIKRLKENKEIQHKIEDNEEAEDRFYEEWTEIYTITVRGIKYKITWVHDPLLNERIQLHEAIRKGIIDLITNSYHNLKTSHSMTINEAIDKGLVGTEEDKNALPINVNGITYYIYWVYDPVKKKRVSPKRAIDGGILDLKNRLYTNYLNYESISIHEAILMKLIGASEDLSDVDEELLLTLDYHSYNIAWVKDTRTGDRVKPREALRRALLDLTRNTYKKHDTNDILSILEAIERGFIGISSKDGVSCDDDELMLKRQDSLLSLDDDELTIKTKTAIYVITGLLHPETQKEIKVSEAIDLGILDKNTGAYKDFKTNVVYEVGEAINEGIVFATVTDLLLDQSASTEVLREEIKRFTVKSVIDPRTKNRIGGLQAQAAGILNYAQGVYTNPDSRETIPLGEAIGKGLITVQLQEETANEEFDAEIVSESLMERCITNYRILGTGVLDPISHQMITGDEAVHKQIIDTETNSYVDGSEVISLKEAINQHKLKAEIHERVERKSLGVSLQNAIRLGLFQPETGIFKDPYTNKQYKLGEAIEKGHINPNGIAVADSSRGMMTLNEAFSSGIFDKRLGIINKARLAMYKAKLVDSKIFKLNFEDAVKCGIINLKNGKYKHMQSEELLSLKDAINRGLIDGDSTILENPATNTLMPIRKALETVRINDNGEVVDPSTNKCITTLEHAFNTRKIFSAFDENTGEIFLNSRGKIVPFEKAVRKNKMDKDVRIFDPKHNKELSVNDAIEYGILDKTTGMIIDPKGGSLLSIREAVKRGIIGIVGAPVVTGHHDSEAIEKPVITSRKHRHLLQPHDDDIDSRNGQLNSTLESITSSRPVKTKQEQQEYHHIDMISPRTKTPIVYEIDDSTRTLVNEAKKYDSLLSNSNNDVVITKIKTTSEEHTKKIKEEGDVINKIKKNYKETVLQPGLPAQITASSNYEYETKSSRIDSNSKGSKETKKN